MLKSKEEEGCLCDMFWSIDDGYMLGIDRISESHAIVGILFGMQLLEFCLVCE